MTEALSVRSLHLRNSSWQNNDALFIYPKEHLSLQDLAEKACTLEVKELKKPIGKQDQYMAAFGGLTILDIEKGGAVHVRKANISENKAI